jgi:hypothetical protein
VPVAGPVDLLDPCAQPGQGLIAFRSVESPPARGRDRLVQLALFVAASRGRDVAQPCCESRHLLIEAVECFEEGCLSGGQVMNAVDAVAGFGELPRQVRETGRDLLVVSGFTLVEDGEAFGVLGDLQQRRGNHVTGVVRLTVHRLVTATGSGPGRPMCR